MIVRIVIALFISLVSGVCYMAGLTRLMSALLLFFGVICALFFGIVFLLPPGSEKISFTVTAHGASWPFFLVAAILALLIGYLFLKKNEPREPLRFEPLGRSHLRFLVGGTLLYILSLFLPVLLWFPSDKMMATTEPARLELLLLLGVIVFIAGVSASLFLIYRSTRGGTEDNPSLMKRFVPALFSVFHFDKIPALAAYLLIYSSQPQLVFPKIGALALAAYIPVAIFLIRISFAMDRENQ